MWEDRPLAAAMQGVSVPTSIQPAGHFPRPFNPLHFMPPGLSGTIFNYFQKFPIRVRCGIRAARSWSDASQKQQRLTLFSSAG